MSSVRYVRDNLSQSGAQDVGKIMTVDEVLKEVKKDLKFYETSGGGTHFPEVRQPFNRILRWLFWEKARS
jgi:hypothetical protein